MIDFRYHLVSLVSVFLALAVGIVLGAGPLKDSIGNTLTEQVQLLRQDKDSLRAQLATAQSGVSHRDTFVSDVTTSLISGQLVGRSVVIVTLPGVDGDVVQPLVDAIATAGGTVTGRISLNGSWVDPAQEESRTKVLTELKAKLPNSVSSGTTEAQLTEFLADSLVSTGAGVGTVGRSSDAGSTVLSTLRSGDLIGVKGDLAGLAGAALVLAPANTSTDGKAEPTEAADAVDEYVSLAATLDGVGGGAVVTGPASSAIGDGVLATIRKNDDVKSRVSTVDTGSTPMGVIGAVLALREQLAGGNGAYGFGSGASKDLPTLAAVATPTVTETKK
jgi:hypothetical protein